MPRSSALPLPLLSILDVVWTAALVLGAATVIGVLTLALLRRADRRLFDRVDEADTWGDEHDPGSPTGTPGPLDGETQMRDLQARVQDLSRTVAALTDQTGISCPGRDEQRTVHVGGSDLVGLSHSLAAAGRMHDAALAQWAADLQVLRPHLGHRAVELCATLASLAPVDPRMAVSGARAAAASLVDSELPVLSLLGPTSHLGGEGRRVTGRSEDVAPPAPHGLPRTYEVALDATLHHFAARSGDLRGVSVTLRRDLMKGRQARRGSTGPVEVARSVLEPHEQHHFEHEMRERST